MASDYLFRRILNNTARPAWQWFFGKVPPADVAAEEPPLAQRVIMPHRAPGARRAQSGAYELTTINQTIMAGNKAMGARRFEVPIARQKGLPRTAQTAYQIAVGVPPQDVVVDFPFGFRRVESPVFSLRRAANTAYQMGMSLPPTAENLPPGNGYFTHRAPGPQRAANTAYWARHNTVPPVEENLPPGTGFFTHRAPGARRAALDAYQITRSPPLPENMPPGRFTEPPRFPLRRAARTAYDILVRFINPDVISPQPTFAPLMPSRAPGYRRAQNTAYLITLKAPVASVPPPPTSIGNCVEFVNPQLAGPMYVNPQLAGPQFTNPGVC